MVRCDFFGGYMENLVVGQKLWWVASNNQKTQYEVEVVKVGRKWATLDIDHKIDLEDWVADGGLYAPPGKCYASKEEYESECTLLNSWKELRQMVNSQHKPPKGINLEKIEQIKTILSLK